MELGGFPHVRILLHTDGFLIPVSLFTATAHSKTRTLADDISTKHGSFIIEFCYQKALRFLRLVQNGCKYLR
jgi:hypothetical protein